MTITMTEQTQIGNRVVGTIKAIKGFCAAGHKVGDKLELSGHHTGGLCGFLYHDLFPYIIMLQFNGGFPPEWGDPDVIDVDCMDKWNQVTIELRKIRE